MKNVEMLRLNSSDEQIAKYLCLADSENKTEIISKLHEFEKDLSNETNTEFSLIKDADLSDGIAGVYNCGYNLGFERAYKILGGVAGLTAGVCILIQFYKKRKENKELEKESNKKD